MVSSLSKLFKVTKSIRAFPGAQIFIKFFKKSTNQQYTKLSEVPINWSYFSGNTVHGCLQRNNI